MIGYTSPQGTYLQDGYDSILVFSPMFSRQAGDPLIQCDQVRLDFLDVPQSPPSEIGLRIGLSGTVADSNLDVSRIVWFQHSRKLLRKETNLTPAQHAAKGTIPTENTGWQFYRKGRVIYVEMKIEGVGGDATFSAARADVKLAEANY